MFLILPLVSLPCYFELFGLARLDTVVSDKLHDFLFPDLLDESLALSEVFDVFIQVIDSTVQVLLARLLGLQFLFQR